jgi:hypothetical protein
MNTVPVDRHARWGVHNALDAIGQDLRDLAGHLVMVRHSYPWVVVITGVGTTPIDSAVGLAAHLNHYGALPQAEHDALVTNA